jgi:Ca2+-binding EF-hand superfamily protein
MNTGVEQISGRLIEDIIRDSDQNGDGQVDYEEFLATMIKRN